MADIIIGFSAAGIVAFSIYKGFINRKKGGAGCGCEHCAVKETGGCNCK